MTLRVRAAPVASMRSVRTRKSIKSWLSRSGSTPRCDVVPAALLISSCMHNMIQRKVVGMNRVFRPELLNLDRAYGWWMSELAAIGQDIAHCIPHRPRTLIEVRIDRKGDAWAVLLGTSEVRCKAESQDELRSVLAKMRRACPRAPHIQLCL